MTGKTYRERETEFGKFVTDARIKQGLLVREVAEAMGVTTSQYSNIETGRSGVGCDKIQILCEQLDLYPDDVVRMLFNRTHKKVKKVKSKAAKKKAKTKKSKKKKSKAKKRKTGFGPEKKKTKKAKVNAEG